jgi:hypothetical protein
MVGSHAALIAFKRRASLGGNLSSTIFWGSSQRGILHTEGLAFDAWLVLCAVRTKYPTVRYGI